MQEFKKIMPYLEELNSEFSEIFNNHYFEPSDIKISYLRSEGNACDKIFFEFDVKFRFGAGKPNSEISCGFFRGKDDYVTEAKVICPINVLFGNQTEDMPTVYSDANSEKFFSNLKFTITQKFQVLYGDVKNNND